MLYINGFSDRNKRVFSQMHLSSTSKKSTLKLAIIYSIDLFNDSKIPHVTTHDQIHIFLKSCKYVTTKVTPFF